MPKVIKVTLIACALFIALPVRSSGKKPDGEIPNPRALAAVQSYCINKSELSDWDRHIVENFLKSESKPKHLLTRLPWKLMESCRDGNPDATATLEFVSLKVTRIGGVGQPMPPVTDARDPDAPIKVVLTVGDKETQALLYRTQAMPLESSAEQAANPDELTGPVGPVERRDAVYHVFWALINDLHAVRASRKK